MAKNDYHRKKRKLKETIYTCMNQAHYYHDVVQRNYREGLENAKKAGDFLNKAKKMLRHGTWLEWLKTHWKPSIETAQIYMRLSKPALFTINPQ